MTEPAPLTRKVPDVPGAPATDFANPSITEPHALVEKPASLLPVANKVTLFLIAACAGSLLLSTGLWSKISHMQEALARQSADATALAVEARTLAKSAQEIAQQTAARQAGMDARLAEVAVQRGQLEDLMQNLSRSRDDTVVADIDAALRLAQQQAVLTGSAEPLLAALKSADQRLTRAAQPRLTPLQRALAKDMTRVKAATLVDIPGMLIKLDELARLIDEAPLANGVATSARASAQVVAVKPVQSGARTVKPQTVGSAPVDATQSQAPNAVTQWTLGILRAARVEVRSLVRVSRIESPEAALLNPEQSFFVRENLKLRVLNARLGVLAHQTDSVRTDLVAASQALRKYFDAQARNTQLAIGLANQVQSQLAATELPSIDDSLAALATASVGR